MRLQKSSTPVHIFVLIFIFIFIFIFVDNIVSIYNLAKEMVTATTMDMDFFTDTLDTPFQETIC